MAAVAPNTQHLLEDIAAGELDVLDRAVGLREASREDSGLDARSFALVKLAALVALDAPPASYAWQVPNALADGVNAEDIAGMMRAIAPQVGGPKLIAAAPEIMLALGLSVEEE